MTMTFKQLVDSTGEFATWRRNYPNAEFISEIGIIPFRGIKSILFTIQCRSYTTQVQNAVRRKKGEKAKPVPIYTDYIQFMDVKFGDRLEDSNWAVIEYKNQKYYFRKPSLFKNPVKVRCNCFTGDTRIMLGNGETATLKELEGQTNIEVISFNTTSNKFEIAKLLCCEKKSDNEELLKITLDNGEQIKTTKDHLFLTKQGEWVEAQNLKEGQSLMALYGYKDNDKLFQKANKKWQRIRKYNNKEDYYVYVYLDPTKPGNYKYSDVEFSYQPFYVGKGRLNRAYSHLKNCLNENNKENKLFYDYLRNLLNNGYEPVIVKQHYGLNEQAAFELEKKLITDIGKISTNTGSLTKTKLLNQAEKEVFYNHKILKIEQIQNDEVYCPTIEGLGNFVIYAPDKNSKLFSGVVVKNCPDFQFRFSWEDRAQQALYGGPPKVYTRKTPPPPLGRPEVNPEFIPGICKHLYDFAKQLEPFVNIIE